MNYILVASIILSDISSIERYKPSYRSFEQ